MIVEIGLHQREPERRRCDISIFGIDRRIVFFYHKAHQEGTKNTVGLSINQLAEALEAMRVWAVATWDAETSSAWP